MYLCNVTVHIILCGCEKKKKYLFGALSEIYIILSSLRAQTQRFMIIFLRISLKNKLYF